MKTKQLDEGAAASEFSVLCLRFITLRCINMQKMPVCHNHTEEFHFVVLKG